MSESRKKPKTDVNDEASVIVRLQPPLHPQSSNDFKKSKSAVFFPDLPGSSPDNSSPISFMGKRLVVRPQGALYKDTARRI